MEKEYYEVGSFPPLGVIPKKMFAWTIREERFGDPVTAFKEELIDVPAIKDDEILVAVMAVGLDYNGIWAGLGKPKNVIKQNGNYSFEKMPFHICGSEAGGIVWAVGSSVTKFKPGDEVIIGGTISSVTDDEIRSGIDEVISKDFRIWGYEENYGGFAQFTIVRERQCVLKPREMSWLDSASLIATGVTVYRMLTHWKGNQIKAGDGVLVWGGTGGLGSIGIQLATYLGADVVAVVSSEERGKIAMDLGAKGYINRKEFHHWGKLKDCSSEQEQKEWLKEALGFRRKIQKILGNRKLPDIVLEHPGQDTLPTSMFVCAPDGMVALCGATTSFTGTLDLRFLWLSQKRLQGSHAGDRLEAIQFLEIIRKSGIKPYIGKVLEWNELADGLQEMYLGKANGKYVVKVGIK